MILDQLRTTTTELTRLSDAINAKLKEGGSLKDDDENRKTLEDIEWLCRNLVERARQIKVIEPRKRK